MTVLALAPGFAARVTNHLARLGWPATATPDYLEIRIVIEATGLQSEAKRGERLYVWPDEAGMRWEIRPPGHPQGSGERISLEGVSHLYLVAEIDHLLRTGR
ncbi:hypothetical protein DN402_31670 [Streptomyces sp. SW4]|nr:hypothetical protein DN402_31670 [Streptomyces sp. SW4]